MFLVPTHSPHRVEHFSCLTRRNPTVKNSKIEERSLKKKKKTFIVSAREELLLIFISFFFVLFVCLFVFKIESGTHMSPFALLDPFQS